jgi:small subunit ribosomal protein S18
MFRRKVCRFCADKTLKIDYKDVKTLSQFVTERGKMTPSRITGNCARHQRFLDGHQEGAQCGTAAIHDGE